MHATNTFKTDYNLTLKLTQSAYTLLFMMRIRIPF